MSDLDGLFGIENEIEETPEKKEKPKKEPKSEKKISLKKVSLVNSLKLGGFVTLLGLAYIFNVHFAEKQLNRLKELNTEVKELKSEYATHKADLNSIRKPSAVIANVNKLGLKRLKKPAYIIESK